MNPQDFAAWIDGMGISDREAARLLGLARMSVAKYRKEPAPLYIGLACAALAAGLGVWTKKAPTA